YSYFNTPEFSSQVLRCFTFFELPINLLGAYSILFKTPSSMKPIKWNMVNLHFWNMVLDILFTILVFFCQLESDFGVPSNVQVICSLVVLMSKSNLKTFSVVCVTVISIMENRYYFLFSRRSCWKSCRHSFMVCNYAIVIGCILFPSFQPSPNVDVFQKMFPEIPISTHSTSLFIFNTDRFYTSLSMFSAGVLIMSETAIFCGLIIWNMWKQHEHTSKRAFEMQKRFLVALAIQISVPFIILAGPATYNCFSILTRYYNPVANNVVLITVSTHGWVSAIVMLTIHEPYRN
ncbi:LOW QUALITY PROTEIN: Protein CBG16990, partial [Caenorhabditis briggsae]